jgi:hypothetical protein
MTSETDLRIGDRVQLSELGKSRYAKARSMKGTVVKFPRGGRTVEVLLDGNKLPTRLHRSYVQPEEP